MYSILLKKNKGDIFPYPLNDIIEKYIKAFGSNDIILAIPGYQSTTQNRIDTLCDELRRIAPNNDIYFAYGMNGNRIVKGGTKTIHDAHYAIKPQVLSTLADHSKCLIFVDSNSVKNTTNILNNNLQIKAMILGSSNISCSTYVDSPTVKGELDIMLINENYYSKANVLYFKNNLTETSLIDENKTEGDINYMVSQSVEFGKEQDNNVLNKYMLSIIENDK